MKKSNLISAMFFIALFLMVSCGKDDAPAPSTSTVSDNNPEDTPIAVSILESGVSISGGKKIEGTPPSPKGTINFVLDKTPKVGFQKSGFGINFTSSSSFAGVYVLLKDVSGKEATSYFDIPVDSLSSESSFKVVTPSKKRVLHNTKVLEDPTTFTVDVNFTSAVPVGIFCYYICIYDADGNVSIIEEECITVKAWGGNPAIVGEWIFDRGEGGSDSDDSTYVLECTNGETKEVDFSIYSKNYYEFVLKEDGSYYEIYDEEYQELDVDNSQEACSAIYGETKKSKVKYIGNWSYNTKDKTLTVIDFESKDLLNPENDEVYPEGDIYIEGAKVSVENDELSITDTEVTDGVPVTYKLIFKRK